MKKLLRCFIFLTIFMVLFVNVFKVLWMDNSPLSHFYREPKNSIDIAYIGASNVYVHFNSTLAFQLYGFSTGLLSGGSQPFLGVKYLLKDAKKLQNPKLYIIDLAKSGSSSFSESGFRGITDSMPFSKNRSELIDEGLKYLDVKKEDYYTYYFSHFIYHNRWKDLGKANFSLEDNFYKGFFLGNSSVTTKHFSSRYIWPSKSIPIDDKAKEILFSLINYIKDNNLNTLFVIPIRFYGNEEAQRINTVVSILEENNFDVINFNKVSGLHINFENNLYNNDHLNIYGSTKYTLYFAKYLKEHYDLPDHRDDKNYAS